MAEQRTAPGDLSQRAAPQVPWWQRELNARLARQVHRRARLRRVALRGLGALGVVVAGVALVLPRAPRIPAQVVARIVAARRQESTRVARGVGHPPRVPATTIQQAGAGDAILTLDPPRAQATGPAGATLGVTVTNSAGAPLPGITIQVTIDGPVPFTGVAGTDAGGVARFPYRAGTGSYTVHLTALVDGTPLATRAITVHPAAAVLGTTPVTGRFYASDNRCTYDTSPGTRPLFTARFPTLNFGSRPFTGYGAGAADPARVAAGGGVSAGVGALEHFDAVFTGSFVVRQAGSVPLGVLIDDAFNLGIGGGATRVAGTMSHPPATGETALLHLPVLGAFNQGHLQASTGVTVRFPHPGVYPYEVDYSECMGGNESLRVRTDGQFLPALQTPGR